MATKIVTRRKTPATPACDKATAPATAMKPSRCEDLLSDAPADRIDTIIDRTTALAELLSLNNSDNCGTRKRTFSIVGDIFLGYIDELRDMIAAERAA